MRDDEILRFAQNDTAQYIANYDTASKGEGKEIL